MLTGNKDVDRKILNNLEDKDLVNVCQTNKKAQSLCNDQVFWMNRVFQRFGYVGGDILRKYKGSGTWSKYYINDLRKINPSNAQKYLLDGAEKGRLDHVMIALRNGAEVNKKYGLIKMRYHSEMVKSRLGNSLNEASENGHLDVVKYLISIGAKITKGALRLASRFGHLDVVKYLVSIGADIHVYKDDALKWAITNKHLDVVKYLKSLP